MPKPNLNLKCLQRSEKTPNPNPNSAPFSRRTLFLH